MSCHAKRCLQPALVTLWCVVFSLSVRGAQQPSPGFVYVLLWFDTEDYILPQSDDAAKRIAEILTRQGVRATFKVVGEKARMLEQRRRKDVIEALDRHEIGYHSDNHSRHPTVAEYEAKLGWQDGAAEFTRRERAGFDDVARIFGRTPSCYGQPGSSWAPQPFAALKSWGVKVYLDDARQVGLDGQPFWYGGLLNIFNLRYGSELRPNNDWSNLAEAERNFQATYTQLQPKGGVVSFYFHPCEFIHREFWDGVNFAGGANPPRNRWRLPPVKSAAEIERDFNFLDGLVAHMKTFPRVRFITASEALSVMPDRAQGRAFSTAEIAEIARRVTPEVSFQAAGDYALTAGEVFVLLNDFVLRTVRKSPASHIVLDGTPYGPADREQETGGTAEVSWGQFASTMLDVEDFLTRNRRIPNVVWMGSRAVSPESYLVALAGLVSRLAANEGVPEAVTLPPARLAAARYIAEDSRKLWGWIIFPPGFDAPELMALARLQAWTLKPAIIGPATAR